MGDEPKRPEGYYWVTFRGARRIAYYDGNRHCPWLTLNDYWCRKDEDMEAIEGPITELGVMER